MSTNEETFVVGADGLDTDREQEIGQHIGYRYDVNFCLLYTSPSPRDATLSRMPSSA